MIFNFHCLREFSCAVLNAIATLNVSLVRYGEVDDNGGCALWEDLCGRHEVPPSRLYVTFACCTSLRMQYVLMKVLLMSGWRGCNKKIFESRPLVIHNALIRAGNPKLLLKWAAIVAISSEMYGPMSRYWTRIYTSHLCHNIQIHPHDPHRLAIDSHVKSHSKKT